ncbi:uncharacterized protein GGS22DRAFT_8486 [Annulohypoxylon maeteangense]|uniref:uncharacterized protein n=1 Tax=Annulohypoxylon maeteangense TaxID=1927788 RepID=UPI002008982B|nr:uncharacterized protein GGS22DRAFT_8486 [Annulohypoxylon maeteangense]KAI0890101.1 hypothetical protein GGS22DRAFT_8486 [Annulohypoxylon maeteangense]
MAQPVTTVVPFASLPSCAVQCGPLYDANGACVPPAAAQADGTTYDSCFCKYDSLQPFSRGTSGVCDTACTADAGGLSSIQGWFTSFCAKAATATASSSSSTSSSTSSSSSNNSGGGDWLSTHWKWVIMIVIIVVGIAGIWTGACIWRRKYLKKKDRMYELGKGLPSSVAVNTQGNLVGPGARDSNYSSQGAFMSGSGNAGYTEKPKKERKKWTVTSRT